MTMLQIAENTPEWHAIRLKHIGGSEIAGLFGVQPEFGQSRFTLYQVKSGRIPAPPVDDSPGSRAWFGRRMEPTIATLAAELYGWDIEKGGYCIANDTPGMACSLDYIITRPGSEEERLGFAGPGVMQVKNSDWLAHKRGWTGNEPPLWILLQLQHEIACAGFRWGLVACLVGNNELPAYRYAARPRIADAICQKVREFWADVQARRTPITDGTDSTAEALRAMFPSLPDEVPVDLRSHKRIEEVCVAYLIAQANLASSKRHFQAAKNDLEAILEGHTVAECEGFGISVAVTKERAPRPARLGETIPGKRAGRRITVKEIVTQ